MRYLRGVLFALALFTLAFFALNCTKDHNTKSSKENTENSITDMEGWYQTGSNESEYSIGRSDGNYNGKTVFYLISNKNVDSGFGAIVKNFMPVNYLEKRIRLSGNIKVEDIHGKAGMWMRIDGGIGEAPYGKTLRFDNMSNRLLTKSSEWNQYYIVLDVPKESRMVFYGVYLRGIGKISLSDFAVDVVGNNVPATDMLKQ